MKLLDEIRRRNVHRAAIGYVAGAWLLVQVAETLFPVFGFSDNTLRITVILLAIGFVPVVILSWFFEWTAEGILRDGSGAAEVAPHSTRTIDRLIVAGLVLAVGYFAVDKFLLDPARDARDIRQASEMAASGTRAAPVRSIAVLPFVNMSADPEQEYFVDGMTEEILNLLAKIPELKVISRSTVFTFKGRSVAIPDVAAQLGVSHVLEGSVRKVGDELRVTAQLIDASEDAHLWSETYDQTLADVFEIQNLISEQVVSALKLELLGQAPTADEIDPRAYDLYLQARHIVHTTNLRDQHIVAKEKLEQVVEIEPNFVPALFELARVHFRFWGPNTDAAEDERLRNEIRALVERMNAIAPMSSYVQGFKAYMAQHWEGDLEKAAFHRERALEGPQNANYFLQLDRTGAFVADIGRNEEAVAISEYVISRDPACTPCLMNYALRMRDLGRSAEAAQRLEEIFEWQIPTGLQLTVLGQAWYFAEEFNKALSYLERVDDTKIAKFYWLASLYRVGRHAEFEEGFAARREAFPKDYPAHAILYAVAGQNDLAFEELEKWMETRGPASLNLVDDKDFDPLKSDPRWIPFVEKYDLGRKDFSHIQFNPRYPPEIEAALADIESRR